MKPHIRRSKFWQVWICASYIVTGTTGQGYGKAGRGETPKLAYENWKGRV